MIRVSKVSPYNNMFKKREKENRNSNRKFCKSLNSEELSVVNFSETNSFSSILKDCRREEK